MSLTAFLIIRHLKVDESYLLLTHVASSWNDPHADIMRWNIVYCWKEQNSNPSEKSFILIVQVLQNRSLADFGICLWDSQIFPEKIAGGSCRSAVTCLSWVFPQVPPEQATNWKRDLEEYISANGGCMGEFTVWVRCKQWRGRLSVAYNLCGRTHVVQGSRRWTRWCLRSTGPRLRLPRDSTRALPLQWLPWTVCECAAKWSVSFSFCSIPFHLTGKFRIAACHPIVIWWINSLLQHVIPMCECCCYNFCVCQRRLERYSLLSRIDCILSINKMRFYCVPVVACALCFPVHFSERAMRTCLGEEICWLYTEGHCFALCFLYL